MRLDLLPRRLLECLKLEVKSLATKNCGFAYACSKWKAVITNSRNIRFLGSDYFYEDRLQPFTLFNYVNELSSLRKIFGFRGGRVLDIGANIGNYGYVLMKQFPGSEVYSFEPNKMPFVHLQRNAANFAAWHIFNFGVANISSNVDFYFVPEKSGQGSIYKENASLNILNGKAPVKTTVMLRPLDNEFLKENCRGSYFDLVKIDVEGAEMIVIEGLSNVNWKYMYVEFSTEREGAASINEFMSLLKKSHSRSKILKVEANGCCTDLYILNGD
jgi:FkbM family methyltransferase